MTIRLLVVDDHDLVREGIVALLRMSEDMDVVAEARDAEEALAAFGQHRPDVAIVDLRLPGRGGPELIGDVRRRHPEARFLVLTTFDGEEDVSRALAAGAQGYVLKGMERKVLLEAVRAVAAGRRFVPRELAERYLPRPPEEALSGRERDVLAGIACGLSNKEIAQRLALSESTVKGHVKSLLAKLAVEDRTQALIVALKRGLVRLE
jgi:DNA-binding NarL/FixJ family response regulator